MTDYFDYFEELMATTNVEDLWRLHVEKMRHFGFDRLIYGFTRYGGENSLGSPDDWLLLSTQTPEYMRFFFEEGHYHNGPMLRWARDNSGACSWRWMGDMALAGRLSPEELKVMQFNKKMGVTAGYTISFRSQSMRNKGAIALTAAPGMTQRDVDDLWEHSGREIMLVNNVMHLKMKTLPYYGDRRLTVRQREVLQWIGDGKSVQDVALLLGRTPATIEKHLRLAREALGVETTAQAVLKAMMCNQIYVAPPRVIEQAKAS